MTDANFKYAEISDINRSISEIEIFLAIYKILKKDLNREQNKKLGKCLYFAFIDFLNKQHCKPKKAYYNKDSYYNHLKKYKKYINKHNINRKANISPNKPKRNGDCCWIHLHHINEALFLNLGSPISIYKKYSQYKANDYKDEEAWIYSNFWNYDNHKSENLVRCNVLEHAFLHAIIIIAFDVPNFDKKNNGYESLKKNVKHLYSSESRYLYTDFVYRDGSNIYIYERRITDIINELDGLIK
ncbi:hypothetical protein M3M35_03675 [Fructilactobacillus myrtifloralis]|uniref:Uncharacterized protein n=1 Tax=Fructilactobacillus myrtifloralis TaxID=2940301 RepID=A0ABY5BU12_9LACO|nr:hypothetical protein [Fructilactobacillus myrtifloralis]USS85743.1 hypothetical protein M3M35_03675 [Fructilactobacillus myrtifloralis]